MSRTDVDYTIARPGTGTKKFWDPAGNLVVNDTWSGTSHHESVKRVGTVTVGYREKKKHQQSSGGLPMNDFYYKKELFSPAYGYREWQVPNLGREVQVGLIDVLSNFGWEPSLKKDAIDEEAIYRSARKLKDRDVDLSVMFGERKETARTFMDAFDRVHDSYRSARQGNWSRSLQLLFGYSSHLSTGRKPRTTPSISRDTANNVLQWQYGVRPILADVKGSALAIAKAWEDKPPRARVTASATTDYSRISDLSANWGIPAQLREWGTYTRKYVLYFEQDSALPALTALGLTNPVSTVYSLTALSFVFDWFLDVGRYLDALDAHIGLSFVRGCTTTFERRTMILRGSGSMPRTYLLGGPTGITSGSVVAVKKFVECRRSGITSFPTVPLPRLTNPFGDSSASSRGVSLAALVRQRLKQ